MILDHIGVAAGNYETSKAFYTKALAPLGIELLMEYNGQAAGFGKDGKPEFWFGVEEAGGKTHVAFIAESRKQVEDFYNAALEAGGKDNGAPGVRAHYHPDYYGAFVFDPDGNNIEAVCHKPE